MKPLGVFSALSNRPPWATFGTLGDGEDFTWAAQQSQDTGIVWVLYFGLALDQIDTPIAARAEAARAKAEAAGLMPYILATACHEEWYAHLKAGRLSRVLGHYGVNHRRNLRHSIDVLHWWIGQQHVHLRRVFPMLPIAFIEAFVNDDDKRFPVEYYQPVPAHTDVLALEGYVHAAGAWEIDVEPFLAHAVSTRKEPIALIVQGFCVDGDPLWSKGPTPDVVQGTARWMRHPRVIAGWVYDWPSYPSDKIRGLNELPEREALEAAMGVTR